MSMNPVQSILVHLDGTERTDARLRFARDLSALHQSALTALFAVAPRFIPESVIADSGRPAWVVPYAGEATADPQTVLLGWKPAREPARAVTAALPVLRRARQVHVIGHGRARELVLGGASRTVLRSMTMPVLMAH